MRRLVLRPGGIGDCLLSLPAVEHLNQGSLEVWTRTEVLPFFPNARSLAASGIDTLGLQSWSGSVLEGFDEIHSWYGAARPEFREALEALHPKVFWYAALPSDDDLHAADFFAQQTGAAQPALPRIQVAARPNRLIWMHPFSGSAKKNWPLEHYQRLARYLEATGRSVQFVVAPHQSGILPGAKVMEDLAELAGWLAGGALYIGNDSGISHLAAAAGARTLALFGPTKASVWAPRGEQVTVLEAEVLEKLSPEHVLDVALAQTSFA